MCVLRGASLQHSNFPKLPFSGYWLSSVVVLLSFSCHLVVVGCPRFATICNYLRFNDHYLRSNDHYLPLFPFQRPLFTTICVPTTAICVLTTTISVPTTTIYHYFRSNDHYLRSNDHYLRSNDHCLPLFAFQRPLIPTICGPLTTICVPTTTIYHYVPLFTTIVHYLPPFTIIYHEIEDIGTRFLYKTCFGHKSTQKAPKSIIPEEFKSAGHSPSSDSVKSRFKVIFKKRPSWIRRMSCFMDFRSWRATELDFYNVTAKPKPKTNIH